MSKRLVLYKDLLTKWDPVSDIKDEIADIFNSGVTHILLCFILIDDNDIIYPFDVIKQWSVWVVNNNKDVQDYQKERHIKGNVLCDSVISCTNSNLYIDFLNTI